MKTKKVNRYWCDFCNKAGLSAGHMRKHEAHCTMNPNRQCRVCALVADARATDFEPVPLSALVAMLPNIGGYGSDEPISFELEKKYSEMVSAAIPALREASGDCPACMMAALRQAKIPMPMAEGFDFSAEMKEIFSAMNERQENYY